MSKSVSTLHRVLGLAVGLGALLAAGAPADLLVLHGGGEIETDGPWRVDGRRILFETPTGRYSSVRVGEVDLEASRARTEREAQSRSAARVVEPVEKKKLEPKWVFTQDDIAEVRSTPGDQSTVDQVIGDPDFDVLSLRQEADATGFHLVVTGTLVNGGSEFKSGLVVQVRLVNPRTGGPIAETRASLQSDELPPGAATRFTARFPNTSENNGMVQVEAVQAADDPFLDS